jgi:argininosuccinate lyase
LPLAYNRDLQEDKRLLFTAADMLADSLRVAAEVVRHSRYDAKRTELAAAGGFADATSLAEYLVARGVPFRSAHQVVGKIVALAEKQGQSLGEMPLEQMTAVCDRIGPDVFGCLGPRHVVARYRSYGAAGGKPLAVQLAAWKKRLS